MVSAAAVRAADWLAARRIVAFSQGGFTARMIARYRPRPPITVFTPDPRVARRLQLVWGARPLLMEQVNHHDEVVRVVDRLLLASGLASEGDTLVILMGDPIDQRPLTNLMRVHRVRSRSRRGPGLVDLSLMTGNPYLEAASDWMALWPKVKLRSRACRWWKLAASS